MNALRCVLVALSLGVVAPAQIVKTIVASGPTNNRYDVVILGDGYTVGEQTKFDQDCVTFTAALFAREPYKTFAGYFNVHTVFRASNQSGADEPDLVPPVYRDTAYDATYNYGGTARCLYIQNQTRANQDAMLAPATEGRVLVLVNSSRYGGCGGVFSVSYTGSSMNEVQIHEMGHSVGGLADEYDYPYQTYSGPEPAQANITTSTTGQKWSHWHGYDGISAFQGAGYYVFGLFRPRFDCLMRTLGISLCSVCQEQLVQKVHGSASPIDAPQPASLTVALDKPNQQVFSFTNIAPASSNALVTWRVDGVVQGSGVGLNGYTFASSAWTSTTHTVAVEVQDRNPLVRSDPQGILRKTRTWLVSVSDPATVDLDLVSLQPSVSSVASGATFDVALGETNHGSTPAVAHDVELFLSRDTTIDANDVYLGATRITGLGANATTNWSRLQVVVPAHLQTGAWWLAALADRTNAVVESSKTNNLRLVPFTVSARGCAAALSYSDPLVYPPDAARIDPLPGGRVHPVVSAPCDAGKSYVVVWGGSGTSPGTALPGGPVLPLNYDLFGQIALGNLNGPIFLGFLGTLDAQGLGPATFWLPGGVVSGGLQTHFAAAIFDSTTGVFLRVTNPVALSIP